MAVAVDRGYCSYDDPVCKAWPEFAQEGKDWITIADVLRHDCGLQTLAVKLSMEDVENQNDPDGVLSRAFTAQRPWQWKDAPNEGHTPRLYHAVTRGWVLSQILMRVDPRKRTVGQFLQDEVAGPLDADFFCGPSNDLSSANYRVKDNWTDQPTAKMIEIPASWTFGNQTVPGIIRSTLTRRFPPAENADRMRELMAGQPGQDPDQAGFPPAPYGSGAPREWAEDDGTVASLARNKSPLSLNQTPRTRQMDTPSSSGHATARGMAKIMGMMGNLGELGGVRILSEEGVMRAVQNPVHALPRAPPPHGEDAFMMGPTHFVQGGWDSFCAEARGPRAQAGAQKRYGSSAFGWGGLGGSAIWFNPVENLGFGYSVTGAVQGLTGDQNRTDPILLAVMEAVRAGDGSAAAKL